MSDTPTTPDPNNTNPPADDEEQDILDEIDDQLDDEETEAS